MHYGGAWIIGIILGCIFTDSVDDGVFVVVTPAYQDRHLCAGIKFETMRSGRWPVSRTLTGEMGMIDPRNARSREQAGFVAPR